MKQLFTIRPSVAVAVGVVRIGAEELRLLEIGDTVTVRIYPLFNRKRTVKQRVGAVSENLVRV